MILKNFKHSTISKTVEDPTFSYDPLSQPFLKSKMLRASKNLKLKNLVFVFGGGGIRGLAYLPLIKKLQLLNIYPDFSVGTSVGALVSLPYMNKIDIYKAYEHLNLKKELLKLDSKLKSFLGILRNNFKGIIKEEVLSTLSEFLRTFDIKDSKDLNNFFAIFSVEGYLDTGVFGSYKGSDFSPSLSPLEALYSSIAVPPVFVPLYVENKELSIFSPGFRSIKNEFYSSAYLFDGGATQLLPLDAAYSLSKEFLRGNTLFVLFNLYSNVISSRKHSFMSFVDSFSSASLKDQLIRTIDKYDDKIPFIMFNLNYDNLLGSSFEIKEDELYLVRGEQFVPLIQKELIKYFKGK